TMPVTKARKIIHCQKPSTKRRDTPLNGEIPAVMIATSSSTDPRRQYSSSAILFPLFISLLRVDPAAQDDTIEEDDGGIARNVPANWGAECDGLLPCRLRFRVDV